MDTLIAALFYDLSSDKQKLKIPAREKRERDLCELVKKGKHPVALFVDEAQELNSNTLAGLKRLMKLVEDGGGLLSIDFVWRVQSRLCRNVIIEYSATEASLIAFGNCDMIAENPNAVGFVLPDVDLEIVDENNVAMPPGVEGLVRCRTSYFANIFAANNPDRAQDAAGTPGAADLR